MMENLQSHRFRRDVERIAGVGVDYLTIAIEAIGLDLDCLDEVQKIIREHAEIVPNMDDDAGPSGAA